MIDVAWVSYRQPDIIPRGYWDQGLLEKVILPPLEPRHHVPSTGPGGTLAVSAITNALAAGARTAVVVVPGQHHHEQRHVDRLNFELAALDGAVVIVTGDECSLFPWWKVDHPNMRLWVMTPRTDDVGRGWEGTEGTLPTPRWFGEGWPAACPDVLRDLGERRRAEVQRDGALARPDRDIGVSFAGQVNHQRRQQCIGAARTLRKQWRVQIDASAGFGQGLAYHHYLDVLRRSKIVLCPAGACTQDSFRVYEALEAGAVPIVDGLRADHGGRGYWSLVYGPTSVEREGVERPGVPFPVIDDWSRLPEVVEHVMGRWDRRTWDDLAAACARWWTATKQRHVDDLAADVAAVS